MKDLIDFIEYLKNEKIYYDLKNHTFGAIMVIVAMPGKRLEVEFFENGEINIEVFASNGDIVKYQSTAMLINERF